MQSLISARMLKDASLMGRWYKEDSWSSRSLATQKTHIFLAYAGKGGRPRRSWIQETTSKRSADEYSFCQSSMVLSSLQDEQPKELLSRALAGDSKNETMSPSFSKERQVRTKEQMSEPCLSVKATWSRPSKMQETQITMKKQVCWVGLVSCTRTMCQKWTR